MKITVNDIPPSNNEFIGNSHNYNTYRKQKERWHWLIKAAIKKKPKKPYDKVMVCITYFFPDRRRRDPDNYSGKMLLDPLVREGIIVDDSFDHVKLETCGDYDKEMPRTEIEITEAKSRSIKVRAVPGDKLYLLAASGHIDEITVNALYINPHGSVWMYCIKRVGKAEMRRSYPESDIGIKLFETRERAEAAVNGKIISV